ncbi:cytochrome c oxidase subunit 4 isoform 2, mitochondrial-like [Hydractinia symbiolongicarpus]|uniref:cytochrome c oxidase subunit 4 isoform 2, mitochondrial-like n=1 Tax=Hydractinia symbiolongicarpus TaxID=13093 RepID=UPI00254C3E2A|nr:cytochrome c oxidase subunit 4 isoform 2, mitochondrial-like [Hydractinia symbiolongicarpus]
MAMRAALQNKAFPTSLSRIIRNSFSTNTRLCTAVYDHTNPAAAERVSESVSDALAAKEKGPWTELSKEDKIALYRSQFPQTMVESETKAPEFGRIVFGVTIGVSVAVAFFTFMKNYVGPRAPISLTDEWREAQREKMKLYRMNPITGISSK